jgi:hypothetical protein
MNRYARLYVLAAATLFAVFSGSASAEPGFDGRKKCSSCHKSQAESWGDTAHAKAMDSLKPKTKAEAKKKAKLDPDKDYTQDKDCVGCHVDGFGKEGGYTVEEPSKFTTGVGCESCHGPGSQYRGTHRKAGAAFEKSKKTTSRQVLADAGQDFHFVERCSACHLNYEGSPWKGAKKPYTPFTPQVDKKYAFDFEKMVRNTKAMHEHYKLDGTFEGAPKFSAHDEFQSKAKVGVKSSED